ncbi:MAG: xanthine dehydrogenase FAD-binding subunit XdhB [Bilophila sp.]
MFAIQKYQKATTVHEAVAMLAADPQARLLAGGTDVLIKLRDFEAGFDNLVDIHDLAQLKPISRETDGTIRIGSGATFTQIMESPLVQACIPLLGEAAASVAGPQIRNVGTLGGNLCNGAVSADTCAPVLAQNGWLRLLGPEGVRTIPALGFHTGPGTVDLQRGELLLCVDFRPEDWEGWGTSYHKYAMREAMDIATIGCAAALRLDPLQRGTIAELRLAYAVAAPIPVRCATAEAVAVGKSVLPHDLPATLSAIADAALADVTPRSSWRATKEFRIHIIHTLAKRVVATGLKRCEKGETSC